MPMDCAGKHPDNASPQDMNRRTFLKLCSFGAVPSLLAACGSGAAVPGNVTPSPTRRPSPTVQPTPTKQPSPTEADWSALARSLQGTLIRPDNSQYSVAHQLFNPRFDGILPAAIASCVSLADVQTCLSFVQRFGLPFTPRSGGHSYAGYSTTTGLVVDITSMNAVKVNAGTGVATIGAGARLIDVYAALAQQGFSLPAGSCPTVGIAGLTLGGGVGVLDRKFGLTCDNLLSAQIILANGRVLTCDASHNSDLFWALRGGGGGNFGVVTSFTFQAHAVSSLSLFTLYWPWSSAADVVAAWQNWAPQAPDELWSNCLLQSTSPKSSNPIVLVNGVYVGGVTPLNSLLQQLTRHIPAAPTGTYVSSASLLDTMLTEAGCYGKTVEQCHLPSQNPQGQLVRGTFSVKSDYFTKPLPRSGINVLVSAVAQCQASSILGVNGIGLDAFGGAINRVPSEATAFVHRNALFSAQYSANWNASDPASVAAANQTWLANTWQAMRPYASGGAYVNYIDPNLPNWQQAYYGANLPRLQQVKAIYDPGNLFHFAQSIPE
jgi:FAD/FMN-containing dehydrogenase